MKAFNVQCLPQPGSKVERLMLSGSRMKFTKSIHWRLLLWIAFLLGLVLLALNFTAYEILFTNSMVRLDEELRHRLTILNSAFVAPPPVSSPGQTSPHGPPVANAARISDDATRLATDVSDGFFLAIWTRNASTPRQKSINCPAGITRPAATGQDIATYIRTRGDFREAYRATESGDCILVGRPIEPVLAGARRFAGWLGLGSLVVLAFGLGGARLIIAGALRPVDKISAAAAKISSGDLSQRINVAETESELGHLVGVLNSTFARLEAAFAQQKQFTADAAHELRTPLAVLISEGQTTLARERTASEYKDALAANLDTAQRMRRLADSLLELSRFDAGQEKLNRRKIDLSAVVEDRVKFVIPLAFPHRLQILCDLAPVEVFGDAERLAQVITNLLTNAIHYNRAGGKIRVSVREETHQAVVSVADTGCGISAADLPRVFERFYSGTKSRADGHTGLGLAISKSIVEAHSGIIEVASQENSGTTFTIRLPLQTDDHKTFPTNTAPAGRRL